MKRNIILALVLMVLLSANLIHAKPSSLQVRIYDKDVGINNLLLGGGECIIEIYNNFSQSVYVYVFFNDCIKPLVNESIGKVVKPYSTFTIKCVVRNVTKPTTSIVRIVARKMNTNTTYTLNITVYIIPNFISKKMLEYENKIKELEEKLNETAEENRKLRNENENLKNQIILLSRRINDLLTRISALEREINELTKPKIATVYESRKNFALIFGISILAFSIIYMLLKRKSGKLVSSPKWIEDTVVEKFIQGF